MIYSDPMAERAREVRQWFASRGRWNDDARRAVDRWDTKRKHNGESVMADVADVLVELATDGENA